MTNQMWKTSFTEYLNFEGVRGSIEEVKETKRNEKHLSSSEHGRNVELTVAKILTDGEVLKVEHTRAQYDLGFGADMLVSYEKESKNYSFFVDVTSSVNYKSNVKYLNGAGEMVDSYEDAFAYTTEYFDVIFGIKERHYGFFFYEKPVLVMLIRNYQPTTGLLISHIRNISNLLISLNELLMDKGHGARASHLVRPNPKFYPKEWRKFKKYTMNETLEPVKAEVPVIVQTVSHYEDELSLFTPLRKSARGLTINWKAVEAAGLFETTIIDIVLHAMEYGVNVANGSDFKEFSNTCNGAYQQFMLRNKGTKGAWKAFINQHIVLG